MFKKGLFAVTLMLISSVSFAGKVVVFDAREALLSTKIAQERFAQVRERPDVAALIKSVAKMQEDLNALGQEANQNSMTWSQQQIADHRKKMEYVQADLKLASQKIQTEQNAVVTELVGELQERIEVLLGRYIAEQDIDLVLRKETSFIAKPDADITKAIVVELDKGQ